MITKQDRQYLIQDMKEVFATKDDVKTIVNDALEPIKKDLKSIKGRAKYNDQTL